MSGVKRRTISDEEYYRLQQNEQQLRAIRNDVPNLINQLRQRTREDFQRQLRPIEQRQRDLQSKVDQMPGVVRDLERDTSRRLDDQRKQFRRDLEQTTDSLRSEMYQQAKRLTDLTEQLRNETRRMVIAQGEHIKGLIEQESNERRRDMRRLESRVDQIREEQRIQHELARSWVEAAELIQLHIDSHYQHERFAAGELAKLKRDIDRAKQNLQSNVPQTALSGAQTAYQSLVDLRLNLEEKEQEWQVWHSAALKGTRELLAIAEHNRTCVAHDFDDKPLRDEQGNDISIDVNYWTSDALTSYERELSDLIEKVKTQDLTGKTREPMSTDELRAIVERHIPEFNHRLGGIIRDARIAVLSSQRRFTIADSVIQSIEREGFVFEDSTYDGSDERLSYVAKMRHLDGGEVVVRVIAKGNDGHELEVLSYDYEQVGGHEAMRRLNGINQGLQELGLSVSALPPQEIPGKPDPRWRNIPQVKRQPVQSRATVSPRSNRREG